MSQSFPHRGGAPVGYLTELDPVEAAAVRYFRLWCEGAGAQEQIWNDFAGTLGAAHGRAALRSLESLCRLCVKHGRRPLMRHDVTCKCIGADEACLANFVASASEGEREDAMLIATLMVRADAAPSLVSCGQTLGLALKRMAVTAKRPVAPIATATLH